MFSRAILNRLNAFKIPRGPGLFNLAARGLSTTADATKYLLLCAADTPNGRKVTVLLEELKATYGLDHDVHKIDFPKGTQKEPWSVHLNPNGRIPVLVEHSGRAAEAMGYAAFQSTMALLHLELYHDPAFTFTFDARARLEDYNQMMQWMLFSHAVQAQANSSAPQDIPYTKKRHTEVTKRIYDVLNIHLADRDWLAGPGRGTYSIADINAFPWVTAHAFAGIETMDEWPNLKAWIARCWERPAVKAGMEAPH